MGNQQSIEAVHKPQKASEAPKTQTDSASSTLKKSMSRSASGADIQERFTTHLLPVEKLAKVLLQKSQAEEGVPGITRGTFCRYLFPKYSDFGEKLYDYIHHLSKAKTPYIGATGFRQQSEKVLAILHEPIIREMYVKLYSTYTNETENITREGLNSLLRMAYDLAMDHYSERPQTCIMIHRTLAAVVESCFHSKQSLSIQFVSHWMEAHCPRLLLPLHRFTVHLLATSYRSLETNGIPGATELELTTPVLDQPPPFAPGKVKFERLMPVSQAWLLAAALPPLYSRPQSLPSPSNGASGGLASHAFMAKLVCAVPSHWLMLYNSDQHGQGANRFLHHVLAYRGPTLILLKAEEDNVFCIASPNEWKESHLYWGSEEAAILQLLPTFALIEQGPKMLYLNTSIRGYPHGLRAGKDPRKPIISIDSGFDKIEFKNIPYHLREIEVWGCGDQASREKQLDVKQWQFKEAERQRNVKLSAADWLDHPDRYLLELAGRQNYNNTQT